MSVIAPFTTAQARNNLFFEITLNKKNSTALLVHDYLTPNYHTRADAQAVNSFNLQSQLCLPSSCKFFQHIHSRRNRDNNNNNRNNKIIK